MMAERRVSSGFILMLGIQVFSQLKSPIRLYVTQNDNNLSVVKDGWLHPMQWDREALRKTHVKAQTHPMPAPLPQVDEGIYEMNL